MVKTWKENGTWKTIRTAIITAVIGIVFGALSSQLWGMFKWKPDIDTQMALIQERYDTACKKVDSLEKNYKEIDRKLDDLKNILIENSKKK